MLLLSQRSWTNDYHENIAKQQDRMQNYENSKFLEIFDSRLAQFQGT